jgi:DNA-binding transcriptional ArsR family regulator
MEALAEYFKVFSEPNRLAVLETLRGGPLNVTAVVEKTGLSQALVSKQSGVLRSDR